MSFLQAERDAELSNFTFYSLFAELHINFDQLYYLFGEAGYPSPPIKVEYRRTARPFTLKLKSHLIEDPHDIEPLYATLGKKYFLKLIPFVLLCVWRAKVTPSSVQLDDFSLK